MGIDDGSNCGRTGRYIYKINEIQIADAAASTTTTTTTTTTTPTLVTIENRFDAWIELVTNPTTDLENHGCWCSRFSNMNIPDNGIPSDEVDHICKQWISARRCVTNLNGACHATDDESYVLSNGSCNSA